MANSFSHINFVKVSESLTKFFFINSQFFGQFLQISPTQNPFQKICKTRLSVAIFFLSLRKFRTRRRHVPTKEKRISTPILIARFRKIFTIFVNNNFTV